jgi:hypothetical protein
LEIRLFTEKKHKRTFQSFYLFLFWFWCNWRASHSTHKAGTLPLELHLQFMELPGTAELFYTQICLEVTQLYTYMCWGFYYLTSCLAHSSGQSSGGYILWWPPCWQIHKQRKFTTWWRTGNLHIYIWLLVSLPLFIKPPEFNHRAPL